MIAKLEADDGRLVAAVWKTATVPIIRGELAYFVYEGAKHPTQAEYQYWHTSGVAGCILKKTLFNKTNFAKMSLNEISDLLFG